MEACFEVQNLLNYGMKFKLRLLLSAGLLVLFAGCREQVKKTATDSTKLIEQVKSRVHEFHAADTSLNAQAVIDLLWPEFTMLANGSYTNYEEVKKGTIPFMESLEAFHTEWTNLKIIPLGDLHAVSSFIFTDSIIAKDGSVTQSTGPNTFVWEKRNGQWKLIYADADHYPVSE